MAFEKSIHLTDCKYRYTISPNVKNSPYVTRHLCKIKLETMSCTVFIEKVPNVRRRFPTKDYY